MKPDKTTDPSQMFDTLVRNALDFLERSAEELEGAPNHSAIDFCTAIELFLKARLLAEHWTLIYDDLKGAIRNNKANLTKFREGDFVSVSMKDAIPRLRELVNLNISKEAETTFVCISQHRNKLIHFFHPTFSQSPNATAIAEVVAEQCRGWYHLYRLLKAWRSTFEPFSSDIENVQSLMLKRRAFLRVRFEACSKSIERLKAKGIVFVTCWSCGFEAMRRTILVGPFLLADCLVCETTTQGVEIKCPACGASPSGLIGGVCRTCTTPIIMEEVLKAYAPLQENRSLCGNRNCLEVLQESDSYTETVVLFDDKWVCLICFAVDDNTWNCSSCGRKVAGESNGLLCFECDMQNDYVWPPMFGGIV